jgi:hypothetical protein
MKSCIRKIVSLIAQHIDPDVEVHKIKIGESEEIEEIPLSRPKSLSNLYELTLYRENCDKNCHPTGECDSCFASDYYYKKYPDGWVRWNGTVGHLLHWRNLNQIIGRNRSTGRKDHGREKSTS